MDHPQLAEDFLANCLAPASADDDPFESSTQLDDGRALIAAACPPAGSAAMAVEINLQGVEKDEDGEVDRALLEAVWNHRLGDGFVVSREADGKDYLAFVAHRATATAPELAERMARLLAIAAEPMEPAESGTEDVAFRTTGWMAV